MSDDTLGNIKVLKWPELPQTSDEHNIDGLIHALLEAETAEQIVACRNELLTAWMGRQARGAQLEPDYLGRPVNNGIDAIKTDYKQKLIAAGADLAELAAAYTIPLFTSPPSQTDSVPREPTEKMIDAGVTIYYAPPPAFPDDERGVRMLVAACYKAMITSQEKV